MQYKTIALELLEQSAQRQKQAARKPVTLALLELYALELKRSHEAIKEALAKAKPGSDEKQIASEAMEIVVKELEDHLLADSPAGGDSPISLDGAIRRKDRLGFIERFALCFEVESQVLVGGIDAHVSQPIGNGAEINTGS